MITVQIAGIERQWDNMNDIEESWVNQHLSRHGVSEQVCIVVRISTSSMNIVLSTQGCGSGGGGRPPTEDERPILDLWQKWDLGSKDPKGGNLIAFLRQLRQVL